MLQKNKRRATDSNKLYDARPFVAEARPFVLIDYFEHNSLSVDYHKN